MIKTDILIIGSGIAGLNFALQAAQFGDVLIVTKKRTVNSSTNFAQGGIAAVLDKTDHFEEHVKDTLEAGCYHNKKSAVECMVKKGPAAIERLLNYGVRFAQSQGKLLLTKEGGHHARRIAFVGDYTGQEIERALIENVKKHPHIRILEHTTALDLILRTDGGAAGIYAIKNKKIETILSRFTVIATGGIGQLYKYTTNPSISTGDGLAMGIRSSIPTKDLEFIQFHPTAFHGTRGGAFLLSEALRGEGAILRNAKGEKFMEHLHPLKDLAPRDVVARAIYSELKHGHVFLDMRHQKITHLKLRFPTIYTTLKRYGYDLGKDLIPIAPATHYSCGGLTTDLKGRTCIKNVYAFGEVAYTGVHGANRLASNSLLEALVFSMKISNDMKTAMSKKQKITLQNSKSYLPPITSPIYKTLSPEKLRTISFLRRELKKIMWNHAGIVRTKKGMQQGCIALKNLEHRLDNLVPQTVTNEQLTELRNMLLVSKTILTAARKRGKSLGAHYIEPSESIFD